MATSIAALLDFHSFNQLHFAVGERRHGARDHRACASAGISLCSASTISSVW